MLVARGSGWTGGPKGRGGETMKEKPQKHSLQALRAWPLLAVVETERKVDEGMVKDQKGSEEDGSLEVGHVELIR